MIWVSRENASAGCQNTPRPAVVSPPAEFVHVNLGPVDNVIFAASHINACIPLVMSFSTIMRSFIRILVFLSIASNCACRIFGLLERAAELKETGLKEDQLQSLINLVARVTCDGNLSTIHYPNSTPPSKEDLLKRDAFVTRFTYSTFLSIVFLK